MADDRVGEYRHDRFSSALVAVVILFWTVDGGRAAILDPMAVMRDDISRIKVMMETVGERMERFNELYLNKLESRLLNSATSMAHIDSNVKNLQERAHVWDTFQLHVSAWNEQIKSLDKKLDILNRGAEKFEMLDEKVASLLSLDYKLNKLMGKLEETDAKVTEIQRKVNNATCHQPPMSAPVVAETPLFSEFTSRGVLSALKDIETKVNKIADRNVGGSSSSPFSSASPGKGNREDLQQKTLEVVNDVAGKVDFILDKMVVKRHNGKQQQPVEEATSIASEDGTVYDDDSDYSSSGGEGGGVSQAERSFVKLWRRMLQPVRRANRKFESLDKLLGQVDRMVNTSARQQQHGDKQLRDDVASLLECCRGNDAGLRGLIRTVDSLAGTVRSQFSGCVMEADLEARLQHLQSAVIRQTGELLKAHIANGVEQLQQSCSASNADDKRKKAAVIFNGTVSGDETTENTIPSQGQATPVEASKRADETIYSGQVVVTTPPVEPTTTSNGKIGLLGCHDLRSAGETETRVYSLASGKELNEGSRDYNTRFCDMTTDGGGWTVIQRRGDYGLPRENFSVSWREYKLGFGELEREFWFGNDFIHRLTNEHDVVLRVELWDFDDQYVYADYESFRVDSEEDLYRLWVEGYQGNATDSLGSHNGYAFSSFDRDNDEAPPCCPCAPAYGGGWWFYSCFEANLNGEYHVNPIENDYYRGIIWELWRGDYSLRRAEMKIRPHDYTPPRPLTTTTTASSTAITTPIELLDVTPEDP